MFVARSIYMYVCMYSDGRNTMWVIDLQSILLWGQLFCKHLPQKKRRWKKKKSKRTEKKRTNKKLLN